jgi:hypothetical protein
LDLVLLPWFEEQVASGISKDAFDGSFDVYRGIWVYEFIGVYEVTRRHTLGRFEVRIRRVSGPNEDDLTRLAIEGELLDDREFDDPSVDLTGWTQNWRHLFFRLLSHSWPQRLIEAGRVDGMPDVEHRMMKWSRIVLPRYLDGSVFRLWTNDDRHVLCFSRGNRHYGITVTIDRPAAI